MTVSSSRKPGFPLSKKRKKTRSARNLWRNILIFSVGLGVLAMGAFGDGWIAAISAQIQPASPSSLSATAEVTANPQAEKALGFPKISSSSADQVDGTLPTDHHQLFENNGKPMIVFVILGLGKSAQLTEKALHVLPKEVTLAFSPFPGVQQWINKAREKDHEALLTVGMEPENYPLNDPGPDSLLTHLPATENIARLQHVLQEAQGVVGITHDMGSVFTTRKESLSPVLKMLQKNGLIFLDSLASPRSVAQEIAKEEKVACILVDRACGESAESFALELETVEAEAKKKGVVVVVAPLSVFLLDQLVQWAETLKNKNIVLAPVTAAVLR